MKNNEYQQRYDYVLMGLIPGCRNNGYKLSAIKKRKDKVEKILFKLSKKYDENITSKLEMKGDYFDEFQVFLDDPKILFKLVIELEKEFEVIDIKSRYSIGYGYIVGKFWCPPYQFNTMGYVLGEVHDLLFKSNEKLSIYIHDEKHTEEKIVKAENKLSKLKTVYFN
jgi:hypothetical protein